MIQADEYINSLIRSSSEALSYFYMTYVILRNRTTENSVEVKKLENSVISKTIT